MTCSSQRPTLHLINASVRAGQWEVVWKVRRGSLATNPCSRSRGRRNRGEEQEEWQLCKTMLNEQYTRRSNFLDVGSGPAEENGVRLEDGENWRRLAAGVTFLRTKPLLCSNLAQRRLPQDWSRPRDKATSFLDRESLHDTCRCLASQLIVLVRFSACIRPLCGTRRPANTCDLALVTSLPTRARVVCKVRFLRPLAFIHPTTCTHHHASRSAPTWMSVPRSMTTPNYSPPTFPILVRNRDLLSS